MDFVKVVDANESVIISETGSGPKGFSAYEIAVRNGYVGTEQEWLASLEGLDGLSAYEVAVSQGYVGTEQQWLASLEGADFDINANFSPNGNWNHLGALQKSGVDVATVTDLANAVLGLFDDRGNFDASGNTFPVTGGSGTAGAILKGDVWTVSVAGASVAVGDTVRALIDTPSQTPSNWAIAETNIGYVPEPAISAGTTAQYWRGDKTWRDFFTDVRAATLTGLSLASSAAITATSTVIEAVGQLQAQLSLKVDKVTGYGLSKLAFNAAELVFDGGQYSVTLPYAQGVYYVGETIGYLGFIIVPAGLVNGSTITAVAWSDGPYIGHIRMVYDSGADSITFTNVYVRISPYSAPTAVLIGKIYKVT